MESSALVLGPDTWVGRHELLRVAVRARQNRVFTAEESAGVLEAALSRGASVYGHSTGYGALASFTSDRESSLHQAQLIAHLATGTGAPFDARVARALVFDRLVTLSKGHSAAGLALLHYLSRMIATNAAPRIPRYGSVGASGDLTPLAHLATVMMGQGAYLDGCNPELEPFQFSKRDALALVNGTSASNALAVMAWWDIAALIPVLVQSMAFMVGAQNLARDAYAEKLHRYRGQPGQIAVAEAVQHALTDIPYRTDPKAQRPDPRSEILGHEETLQAAYSFRCIPQILGPTLEMLWQTGTTLEREINAVTDNPVFDLPDEVFHGGNFHGHVVAQACDSLTLGVANLAVLLDRQIARITDPLLNHGLPPFLTGASVGAHSGFMGAQVSATALAAELSASAQRRYLLQSRSTNGANQDVVSMSTLAGVALYDSLPRLRELTAIHLLVAVQALEVAQVRTPHAKNLRAWVRQRSGFLSGDRPLSAEIEQIAADLALMTTSNPEKSGAGLHEEPVLTLDKWSTLFPDILDPLSARR